MNAHTKQIIEMGFDAHNRQKQLWNNPEKAFKEQIAHTVYLKKESDLEWFLSKKGKMLGD